MKASLELVKEKLEYRFVVDSPAFERLDLVKAIIDDCFGSLALSL